MNTNLQAICWALVIALPIAALVTSITFRAERRRKSEMDRLWETGATRLLAQVWGLSNDRQPEELPFIGEPAHVTREKILQHIWKSDRRDKFFEQKVCGEEVKVTLQYPNTLFGFVDKAETLTAIQEAHNMMADPDQQLYVGTIPLVLDIRVTDPGV